MANFQVETDGSYVFEQAEIKIQIIDAPTNDGFFEQTKELEHGYVAMAFGCWSAYWNEMFQMYTGADYPQDATERETEEVNSRLETFFGSFCPRVTVARIA